MPFGIVINAVVEGSVDEAVVRRLIMHVGAIAGAFCGKKGKENIRRRIHAYNNAARHAPWIIVVDLDRDAECAPPLRNEWLPEPAPFLCFRIAVREVESWLMADRQGIASFLRVNPQAIPIDPEKLTDPKETLVNLARQSRDQELRKDMVPRPGSGRAIGPAYSSRLIEFAARRWRPEVAAARSNSLNRAIRCLKQVVRAFYRETK